MKKHGYVRVAEDSQLEDIDSIAEALRSEGLEVSNIEIGKVTGQFNGTAEEADLPRIKQRAASLGAEFVSVDDDEYHHLPSPDAELQ